jgi:hypothetical protein
VWARRLRTRPRQLRVRPRKMPARSSTKGRKPRMSRCIDQVPSVILPALRCGGPGGAIPPATRPELKTEKGQPGTAPMWQWTRQRPQQLLRIDHPGEDTARSLGDKGKTDLGIRQKHKEAVRMATRNERALVWNHSRGDIRWTSIILAHAYRTGREISYRTSHYLAQLFGSRVVVASPRQLTA